MTTAFVAVGDPTEDLRFHEDRHVRERARSQEIRQACAAVRPDRDVTYRVLALGEHCALLWTTPSFGLTVQHYCIAVPSHLHNDIVPHFYGSGRGLRDFVPAHPGIVHSGRLFEIDTTCSWPEVVAYVQAIDAAIPDMIASSIAARERRARRDAIVERQQGEFEASRYRLVSTALCGAPDEDVLAATRALRALVAAHTVELEMFT